MSETKIQQRALILQEISKLRLIPQVSDADVEAAIKALSHIEDKLFLCNTILKEIDGSIVYFDGVLAILAINLAKDVLEKSVFSFLENKSVKEEKKLFLINVLNQAGHAVDPNLIHAYVENADELIDLETEKFLKMAEVNPEAQIDFLDFYFGVSEDDADILLNSIISDYSGDLLANILTPLIYSVKKEETIKVCVEGLLKSKSYLAFAPLEWLIKTAKSPTLLSLTRKTKNELKIAGLRKNITTLEYYTELFKNSKPLDIFVSSIDGASNFSYIFSRKYDNGSISAFFAVINLETGPVSCFGLSNISEPEYKGILQRFFRDTEKIPLNFSFGKALLDHFCNFAAEMKKVIPYELLCWRQLTYDIKTTDAALEDFMAQNLVCNSKINEFDIRRAINSDYASAWFFTYNKKNLDFTFLIDKLCALKEGEFEKFDILTSEFIKNTSETPKKSTMLSFLKKRFLYQGYFLKCLEFENLSSLFYSIYCNDEALCRFYEYSIKKSVYEFFLNLQNLKDCTDENNIFSRGRKLSFFDFNAKKMLELIEKKWTN